VTFDVDGGIKDMQAMLAEARARGVALPLVERALDCYEETKQHRSGGAEISTVAVYWANRGKQ
jgi:3-hydroxyisobutyrate dehydrogenase-like beta-hydroxyacid dehydrogenase